MLHHIYHTLYETKNSAAKESTDLKKKNKTF